MRGMLHVETNRLASGGKSSSLIETTNGEKLQPLFLGLFGGALLESYTAHNLEPWNTQGYTPVSGFVVRVCAFP